MKQSLGRTLIHESSARSLADLLALAQPHTDPWTNDELGAIFQCQLAQPLEPHNTRIRHWSAKREPETTPLLTVGDLLRHPCPQVAMLERIKNQTKADQHSPNPAQPAKVAFAIYYLCIAAALVRCQVRITTLAPAQLVRAFAQFGAESWLDKDLKQLLQAAGVAARRTAT